MFTFIKEDTEQQARTELNRELGRVRLSNWATTVSFLILLIAVAGSGASVWLAIDLVRTARSLPTFCLSFGIGIVGIAWVICLGVLRRRKEFVLVWARRLYNTYTEMQTKAYRDFLFPHFCAAVGILILVVVCATILFLQSTPSDLLHTFSAVNALDHLRSLRGWLVALLGAELTLLTFLFGSLVGKYSGVLARSLLTHPAIVTTLLLPTLGISVVVAAEFGYSTLYVAALERVFYLMSLLGLLLVAWITVTGVETDKAVRYAGIAFARSIRRIIKKPHIAPGVSDPPKASVWQRTLARLWLPVIDLERLQSLQPFPFRLSKIKRLYMGLFNAAHRAVNEQQHEVVTSALNALVDMTEAYADRRRLYFSIQDEIATYANHQMSAFMNVVARDPNQELLREATVAVGHMGQSILKFARYPDLPEAPDTLQVGPTSTHEFSGLWVGLLEEAFAHGAAMQRSTASHEVLDQVVDVSYAATKLGAMDLVLHNCIPAVQRLHGQCLKDPSLYKLVLSSVCFQCLLQIWALRIAVLDRWRREHQLHKQMIRTVRQMVEIQLPWESQQGLALWFTEVKATDRLLGPTRKATLNLQGLYYWLARSDAERKERLDRSTINDMADLVKLVGDLGISAVQKDHWNPGEFSHALFEMGCVTFCVLPDKFDQPICDDKDATHRQKLVKDLYENWVQLTKVIVMPRDHDTLQWMPSHFALLGLGICEASETQNKGCKAWVSRAVLNYAAYLKDLLPKVNDWYAEVLLDYVQLIAAWVYEWMGKTALLSQLEAMLPMEDTPYGRTRARGGGLSSSYLASMGYPTHHGGGVAVPFHSNMTHFLSQEEMGKISSTLSMMADEEMLKRYANHLFSKSDTDS